jgi:mono/diheme cytochrome c family protein
VGASPTRQLAPNTAKSAEWNRGAYLAEALAHCGDCHTPRNLAFALDNHRKFAGAVAAGWRAYDITSDKGSGIGAWSDDEVFAYLAKGHAMGRGTASGPMGEAVDHSFSQLEPADIRALVAYLRSRRRARPQGVRAGLRQLPQLDWRERDLTLRNYFWQPSGQRSDRDQCCADCYFRHATPHAGRDVDACLWQHLFGYGDRGGRQLRHRTVRQHSIQAHGKGRRGASGPDRPLALLTND